MNKKLILSHIIPAIILVIRPFGMSLTQSIVLGALLLTIIWWVTGIVNKTWSSLFLLSIFALWGSTPLERILQFPLSPNFVLIVFAFIFSEGIMNSKLAEKLIEPLLLRFSNNIYKLLLSILALSFVLIFVIPQPFSRIIILGMILKQFFSRRKMGQGLSEVLLFYTFSMNIILNMMFRRGDIILNNALISIAQIEISENLWLKAMLLPTMVFAILAILLFVFIFRKEMSSYCYVEDKEKNTDNLTKKDYVYLSIIASVVILWVTEPWHGISSSIIIVFGTALMAISGLITLKDLRYVNIGLLLFITAAFSIGVVMNNSGIAKILFSPLSKLMPSNFGIIYLFIAMIISMLMHMVLGSNITTMSVVIPSLMLISSGIVPPLILVFVIYISVSAHYILPFHNIIVLIGNGKGFYGSKLVAKYGLGLTILVLFSIAIIYFYWWQIIGMV